MSNERPERLFSLMENAPWPLVYLFHGPYWGYLMLRYRGIALPAISNPGIEAGGLSGESKTELLRLLGNSGRKHLPPFITVPAGKDTAGEVEQLMHETGFDYPVVAKPDIGRNGRGVKKVINRTELATHLEKFPKGVSVIVQDYIPHENEAGVFYVRKPSQPQGRITSLTLKYFPTLIGDGHSTLRELIVKDPRARRISELYFRRHQKNLERIPLAGERYPLVSVGNHVRGALFEDGAAHVTPAMTNAFDRIAKEIPGFYYGRFDVRFADLEQLKRGEGFSIIEYNGASSEPTHVWDRRTSITKTYKDLLQHWKFAFEVGAENRARGVSPVPVAELLKRYRHELALLRTYPDEE